MDESDILNQVDQLRSNRTVDNLRSFVATHPDISLPMIQIIRSLTPYDRSCLIASATQGEYSAAFRSSAECQAILSHLSEDELGELEDAIRYSQAVGKGFENDLELKAFCLDLARRVVSLFLHAPDGIKNRFATDHSAVFNINTWPPSYEIDAMIAHYARVFGIGYLKMDLQEMSENLAKYEAQVLEE